MRRPRRLQSPGARACSGSGPAGEPEGEGACLGPGMLSQKSWPPCSCAISCAMARPRPVPRSLVVKNGSKIRASRSSGIPGPESRDLDLHCVLPAAGGDASAPAGAHRLARVAQEVQQQLAELAPRRRAPAAARARATASPSRRRRPARGGRSPADRAPSSLRSARWSCGLGSRAKRRYSSVIAVSRSTSRTMASQQLRCASGAPLAQLLAR